ncbi:hypothetical protein CcI156_09840 [Frankia sp. CcI156]|uniref:hypothetical protein n=1 Tax=Frankia TaxID=1854 RepID=UPI00030AE2A0|nr:MULTISPECIES: hypothetical protein [Frankia]ETA03507.1 hypothetical protein CcI6DRAFT_00952 [Frankia sp. CcI6]EYT93542.1 hypothetical protein ThrDRAFT_00872 [Frankia casuarinae]KDA43695.1 hypothetical protein BMG523Draft_01355 [Frankia sp. BMG5.23]KEZ35659.1 hypothetical protein CEDDRAFT_02969 [Frankia sp. CeD]KFB05236.1 hypothetical protein ALLO2DRAFT_02061 [Frankia sp. Allo2]
MVGHVDRRFPAGTRSVFGIDLGTTFSCLARARPDDVCSLVKRRMPVVATLAAPGARIRLDPDGPVASASGGASR